MRNFLSLLIVFFSGNLLIAQNQERDTIRALAQKSDGIYSILRNNGFPPNAYIHDFLELNKKKLNGSKALVLGEEYILAVLKTKKITEQPKKEKPTNKTDELVETSKKKISDSVQAKVTPAVNTEQKVSDKSDSVGLATSSNLYVNYPLFGEELSRVAIKNNDLKGAVFYLMSGHGGPDPGSVEQVDGKLLAEDEYAYDVSLRLARYLIERGAKVTMIIRDKNDGIRDERLLEVDYDEVNYPSELISLDQLTRLKQRVDAVNDLYTINKGKYQRLVTIHVDSRGKNRNMDVYFYYHKKSATGKRLAQGLQGTFKANYKKFQPNRKYYGSVTSRTLYVVKNTLPAMVYVELGNIKNKRDQKRLFSPKNREVMAKWLGEGLQLDYERSKQKDN
ncbi:N-acetylmuramoyl-L-alanine amidase [Spongiivirga sp. MCCC 1A20706]|uniref:N-acetylmuramoyl-L-alanine amidase family protein n=1 Tax=Spongiivirga sp. MCCC 1A20706 TaxID=3160963 RepID=UPI0039774CCA